MAVTYNRYKFVTVSLPKRLRNGRFNSETAVRRFQKRNRHLDPEALLKIRWAIGTSIAAAAESFRHAVIVFPGGGDGRGYRNMCKIPRGSNSNQGE